MFAGLVQRSVFTSPAVVAPGGGAAVTLNPTTGANKSSEITLSGGNLTASHGTTFNLAMVRATAPTSGTKIFKATITAVDAGHSGPTFCIEDGTIDLNSGSFTVPGISNSNGVAIKLKNSGWDYVGINNDTTQTNYWDGGTHIFEIRLNTVAHTFSLYRDGVLMTDTGANPATFTLPTFANYYVAGGMDLNAGFTADFSGY